MLIVLNGRVDGPAAVAVEPQVRQSIVTRKSPHFVLHTDSPVGDADAALERMEQTLQFAVRCWGKEQGESVECYLVRDLRNWTTASLPHPLARIFVGHVGGATLGRNGRTTGANAGHVVIYSSAAPGIVEHEVMHAYCSVNFGEGGPEWFREGMAEMASYREDREGGVRCPHERLAELRQAPLLTIPDVRKVGRSTKRLTDSLTEMLAKRAPGEHLVALDAWSEQDSRSLAQARREYLSSWALCHLLYHNPNYSSRFRTLADGYLSGRNISFEQVFAPMQREMLFEYRLFVQHATTGYRVDLCRWDWNRPFTSLEPGTSISHRCEAARGWQATGLTVVQGTSYRYRAGGSWSSSPVSAPHDAGGAADGTGQLTAILMQDFQLGEPFRLGADGVFVAPSSGRLYLRHSDAWNAIENNEGSLQVELTRLPAG